LLQQPLGWLPGDPAPLEDTTLFPGIQDNQPLHAWVSTTKDPYVFNMAGFNCDLEKLGDKYIEVAPDVNAKLPPLDTSRYASFERSLRPRELQLDLQPTQNMVASTSYSLYGPGDSLQSPLLGSLNLTSFFLDNIVDNMSCSQFEEEVILPQEVLQASTHQIHQIETSHDIAKKL
jgi:hypothetical protein